MLRLRRFTSLPRALWVLAIWLGATFLSEAHHFTVRHVVCPEHGELIDDRGDGPADAPDTLSADEARTGFDGPHACDTPPVAPVLPALAVQLPLPPPAPALRVGLAASPARAALAPLSLAPKTSPPQA